MNKKIFLGIVIFAMIISLTPSLFTADKAFAENNGNGKALGKEKDIIVKDEEDDFLKQTQESVIINPNSKVRLSGAKLESVVSSTGIMTVNVFGIRFNVNGVNARIINKRGVTATLNDFLIGDSLSIDGIINRDTGAISATKIANQSLQFRAVGQGNVSNLEKRIQELLDLLSRLQEQFRQRTGTDVVAPIITSISSSGVSSSSATVSWTTNELATSKAYYGTVSPLNLITALSAVNTTFVTSHSLTLVGLTSSTTYFFVAESKDAANNMATSTQQSFLTTP